MGQLHKQVIDTPTNPSIYNPLRRIREYHWMVQLFIGVPLMAIIILGCTLITYFAIGLTWLAYPNVMHAPFTEIKMLVAILYDSLLIYVIGRPTKTNIISFVFTTLVLRYLMKVVDKYATNM